MVKINPLTQATQESILHSNTTPQYSNTTRQAGGVEVCIHNSIIIHLFTLSKKKKSETEPENMSTRDLRAVKFWVRAGLGQVVRLVLKTQLE